MATRKSVKDVKKLVDTLGVKALDPRDPDTKYFGTEPAFVIQPENRNSEIIRSLNWYSRFYGRKDAKDMIVQYLSLTNNEGLAKVIRKVEESSINPSMCWLARMTLRGLKLTDEENKRLQAEIQRLVKSVTNPEYKESQLKINKKPEEKKEVVRPNVQEVMKEKAREAAGEIEGMYDDYITSGAKAAFNFKPLDELSKKNILPQHIHIFTDTWTRKRDEILEVIKGKDAQLVQGYSHFTKTQLKNILKFIEKFLADFNSYVSIKKAAKAPRARKAIPVEKQVSKLKFLKEFKDAATKLNLVSLHPVKLHGSSECYLYDTAKRKLIYLCADEYSKTFTVKGTTILGFDSNKSKIKTLRKPGELLPAFMKLGKPAGRKFFDDIRAVDTAFSGRTNENIIILKAW